MKIVAFMQNAWFPLGTDQRHIDLYHTDQDFHQRLLASTMSGKRLVQAFGPVFFKAIWWDNSTKATTAVAAAKVNFDVDYIGEVLVARTPELILTFGNEAKAGVELCELSAIAHFGTMHCHHPNARHKTQADLNAFAKKVRECMIHHDAVLCDTPSIKYLPTTKYKQKDLL